MPARTVSNPRAATHEEAARCPFAIELRKRSWIVAFNTPLSDGIGRQTLKACNWQGLLALIDRCRGVRAGNWGAAPPARSAQRMQLCN